MKPRSILLSCLLGTLALGCSGEGRVAQADPQVTVHYLGHASFLLGFGDGATVLTDYGASRAWGLDSPVHPLGEIVPDIVTLSHDHEDHAGGSLPEGIPVFLRGKSPHADGDLTITPIPTFEGGLEAPDNYSFLFEYRGLKILHLGDCQGLMVALGGEEGSEGGGTETSSGNPDRAEIRDRIRTLYPHHYDLVLLPIGFVQDILPEASAFAALLDARRIVPMHFWSPADRDSFLNMMDGKGNVVGGTYRIRREGGPALRLEARSGKPDVVEVIGLAPGPPSRPQV